MILRHIASSLKKKDWSSALIEILVVVAGIFIALQVDDWNQGRKDRLDEQEFLVQLHEDLLVATELSSRVRQRRLDRLELLVSASDVLFKRTDREVLTAQECNAIVWSTAFNVTAPGLSSVDELIASGRMGIIRDTRLRTALVALRQSRAALDTAISYQSNSSNTRFLPSAFPHLIRLEAYFDDGLGEISSIGSCDTAAMREDGPFLTQFSANTDSYDAYLRDGLKPWSSQSDSVHEIVDDAFGVDHE